MTVAPVGCWGLCFRGKKGGAADKEIQTSEWGFVSLDGEYQCSCPVKNQKKKNCFYYLKRRTIPAEMLCK